jgi:hypothetical protein
MMLAPVEASVVCPRCGNEVCTSEYEDHLDAHQGKAPRTAIVPAVRELPEGVKSFTTMKAEYVTYPDGRMARVTRDGAITMYARCPRCHRLVDVTKTKEHEHCLVSACGTVGFHIHCPLLPAGCLATGTRHALLHVQDVWRLKDISTSTSDEWCRLADLRPELVEEKVLEGFAKQDRKISRAKRDTVCSSCRNPLVQDELVELVHLKDGSRVWIHPACPTPSPTPRRVEAPGGDNVPGTTPEGSP